MTVGYDRGLSEIRKGLEDVEYATLEWVAWYNSQRLMEPLGYVPPIEYEAQYRRAHAAETALALN
jgi:putative transposase